MDVRVSGLFVYPVKSFRGFAVDRAAVDAFGLWPDRRFMVVSPAGMFHTQRELPQMARFTTAVQGNVLRLCHENDSVEIPISPPPGEPIEVVVWRDRVRARRVTAEVDAWISRRLGVPVVLAHIADDVVRPVDPTYAAGSRTGFADGFPLLVVGQASLDDLNARLPSPVPMTRFRPNLVVTGAPPFAEDGWRRLRIGGIEVHIVKPCARCAIVGTDPLTGERDAEPLRTLATYRRVGNEVMFGQNAVNLGAGTIAIGDAVEVFA